MPSALVAAALTVSAGCGAARSPGPAGAEESSVRFSDVTDYLADGKETITGAFDWSNGEGWTEGRYGGSVGFVTHYRFVPDDEYYDVPEQWQEIWLGKSDLVYRLRRQPGEAAARIREYFDYGVQVDVEPPCIPAGAKGALPPCEEETG